MESSFTTMVSIRDLEKWAVEKFKQCPKHITIIRHADREDDSQFHCVPMLTKDVSMVQRHEPVDFIVPGQTVIMVEDPEFGLFSIIRVTEKEGGPEFALVTSVTNRMGFLLPLEKLPPRLLHVDTPV